MIFNVYFSCVCLDLFHPFVPLDHMHQLIDRLDLDGLLLFAVCLVFHLYLCYVCACSSCRHLYQMHKHIVVDYLLH